MVIILVRFCEDLEIVDVHRIKFGLHSSTKIRYSFFLNEPLRPSLKKNNKKLTNDKCNETKTKNGNKGMQPNDKLQKIFKINIISLCISLKK